jgi:hypothetical protein
VTDVAIPDGFRLHIRALRGQVERGLCELAAALYAVNRKKLWKDWGYTSFINYVVRDLEMNPKVAYDAIGVFERFQPVWDRAQELPWNRLLEAAPLLTAQKRTPEALVAELAKPESTVRAIREWKEQELRPALPGDAAPAATAKGAPPPPPSSVLRRHEDVEVLARWTKDGTEWIKVGFFLPRALLEQFTDVLHLARRILGIERDADDTRWTLPRELEAVCQEVTPEWEAQLA